MSNYLFLNHLLDEDTPGYGGTPGFSRASATRICEGCSSNTETWSFSNHIGTHVDLPKHFDDQGDGIEGYLDPRQWIAEFPALIDIPCTNDQIIGIADIEKKLTQQHDTLLIRTGFEQLRGKREYWNNNPGIDPEVGKWLRKNFSKIKFIGFDFISLTPYQNRVLGREAHRCFLSPAHKGAPIRIIEDMKLSAAPNQIGRMIVSPLFVKNADGAQVSVLAQV